MRIALLNRFLPPAPGVSGVLLYRLAAALAARAPALRFSAVCADLAYGRRFAPSDAPVFDAVRLRSWQRHGKLLRLPAALHDGWRMARLAAAAADDVDVDVVLSCTDPPLLGHWLGRRLSHAVRWVEWCMDRYPEAFAAAAGLPCPPSPFRAPFRALWPAGGRRPDLRLCLGPGQAAWLAGRDRASPPHLLLPAGVTPPPAEALDRQCDRLTLIYAGNLGRAHAGRALAGLVGALDPARFRLIVAAHGSSAARLRRLLADAPGVDWRDDPVDDETLDRADVHLVSLKPAWTHICAPSKAVTALCRGRPVLFFGDGASDVWRWAAGQTGGPAAGWRVGLDAAGRPDPLGLSSALAAMAAPDGLAAATMAARSAGDWLRAVENASLDALAAWLLDGG